MLKFDEKKQLDSVAGALALRSRIEEIVDGLYANGIKNICWMGIGGTYASCMQVEVHMRECTTLDIFVENAAEYCATGNNKLGEGTVVIVSSVTGNTAEMLTGVKKAKAAGAKLIGFIDRKEAELAQLMDYEIAYPSNEQLKFFMVADRFMFNAGEFPEYDAFYVEMDTHLPHALVEAEKQADSFGETFAKQHLNDPLHYFVGAGNQYGATYSYAMCYWEEMHWMRTKSIHSAEFFHGMLEIVEKDTAITVFVGEDSQRELSLRVTQFLPRVCENYTIIDTKDYALAGISPQFRGNISHLVMHAITQRIDAHLEALSGHPMETRRYYRKMDY